MPNTIEQQFEKAIRPKIKKQIGNGVRSFIRSESFAKKLGISTLMNSDLSNFVKSDIGRGWLGYTTSPNWLIGDMVEGRGAIQLQSWLSNNRNAAVSPTANGVSARIALNDGLENKYRKSLVHIPSGYGMIHWYKLIMYAGSFPFYTGATYGFLFKAGEGRSEQGRMVPQSNKGNKKRRNFASGHYFYPIKINDITAGWNVQKITQIFSEKWSVFVGSIENDLIKSIQVAMEAK